MTAETVQTGLAEQGYVASADLAMALHLALALGRPVTRALAREVVEGAEASGELFE